MRRGLKILGAIPFLLVACAGEPSSSAADPVRKTASSTPQPTESAEADPTVSAPPVVAFEDIVLGVDADSDFSRPALKNSVEATVNVVKFLPLARLNLVGVALSTRPAARGSVLWMPARSSED